MITCTESFLHNQAAAAVLQGYLFSPIARPSCPFEEHAGFNQVGWGFSPDQALLSKGGGGGGGGGGELVLTPLQPLAHAHPKGENKGMMDNSFEARLGLVPQVDKAVVVSEAGTDGMEDSHEKEAPRSLVLVVMDANKELSINAIEWALTSVVQKGDTVKLLGVLQHIMNPMGYKSRADENSWNGASRKVLDTEIATHLAMFKSIPGIYERVEKLGATLDIEVRAHLHSTNLVVEEAKKLGARYVVIDRHIKKDKKFFIENLTCYVTRVKTLTNFEHLRHGLPFEALDGETVCADEKSVGDSKTPTKVISKEIGVSESVQHSESAPQRQQQMQPPSPTSVVLSSNRPGDFYNDDSITFEDSVSAGLHGPELMGNAYNNQVGANMGGFMNNQEQVRRWLIDAGSKADPYSYYPMSVHGSAGYLASRYPGETLNHHMPSSVSSRIEGALDEGMSHPYNPDQYPPVHPVYVRKQSAECGLSPLTGSHPAGLLPRSPDSPKFTKLRQSVSAPKASGFLAASPTKYPGALDHCGYELRNILAPGSEISITHGSPVPISVQPRRADTSWALDLLNAGGLGSQQGQPAEKMLVSTPVSDNEQGTKISPVEEPVQVSAPNDVKSDDTHQGPIDRISSVRRAVSSRKHNSGAPPLCSICHQKSPEFGKVKRFTYLELQEATHNFSADNYLAEGGYGSVYKGRLKEGQLVAVKQHKLASSQGDEEFCAEVEVLSCAQHRNLVTLIGYCVENHLRLLVYEYVCNGSLDRHLSGKSKTELQWQHRHKIALGAARALRYLHEECRVGCIVHRDMRPNNILLTHDFTPMVGDFGLARRQLSGEEAEETRVLGTIGYLAPEYAETGQITDKADVYAFGVCLLELITGRKAIDYTRSRNQISLTEWARPLLDSYSKELVDPRLKMQYDEYELHCMMHAANQCVKKDPTMRPRMTQVLRILNPPQEEDWLYGRARRGQEVPSSSRFPPAPSSCRGNPNDLPFPGIPQLEHTSSSKSSSSTCSQSEASIGSHSDTTSQSETESLSHQQSLQSSSPSMKATKSRKSKWKLLKDKVVQDDAVV